MGKIILPIIVFSVLLSVPLASVDAFADQLTGTNIPVGIAPIDIAYDPVNERMYVVNGIDGTVSAVSTSSNTVIATIPVGSGPHVIAYDSVNERMYVVNGDGTMSVISTSSNTVIATITIVENTILANIAYDPVNERMYVVNFLKDTVSVISTSSNTVIATIPVGSGPRAIAYDPVNERMYVVNSFDDAVSVISTSSNTIIATIPVGNVPQGLAYDPVNERMYVGDGGGATIVISTPFNVVINPVNGFTGSFVDMVYDPINERMYSLNGCPKCNIVSFVSTSGAEVAFGTIIFDPPEHTPSRLAYDPINERMYVLTNNGPVRIIEIINPGLVKMIGNFFPSHPTTGIPTTEFTIINNLNPTLLEEVGEAGVLGFAVDVDPDAFAGAQNPIVGRTNWAFIGLIDRAQWDGTPAVGDGFLLSDDIRFGLDGLRTDVISKAFDAVFSGLRPVMLFLDTDALAGNFGAVNYNPILPGESDNTFGVENAIPLSNMLVFCNNPLNPLCDTNQLLIQFPAVTITSPSNDANFDEDQQITFTGTAIDPEDGDISSSLQWFSDIDGPIEIGASVNISTLSAGTHTITADVYDSGNLHDSDSIQVNVNVNQPFCEDDPCNDEVSCTVDTCDEDTDTCDNTPDDILCDDGAFCNGSETCDSVNDCQAGTPPVIDDGVGCTDDSCDEVNDTVVNAANNALCDDGAFCNGSEICDAVNDCQAGTPPVSDDQIACTDDSCDEINDVIVNNPDDSLCPAPTSCTVGMCVAGSDCEISNVVDGTACEDTGVCMAGVCTFDEPPKVDVCHKGKKTLSISSDSVDDHIGHGDELGECPPKEPKAPKEPKSTPEEKAIEKANKAQDKADASGKQKDQDKACKTINKEIEKLNKKGITIPPELLALLTNCS